MAVREHAEDVEETTEQVRRDLENRLKQEVTTKTTPSVLESHADEVLESTGAAVVEDEAEVRLTWTVAPYTVEVTYEKPTSVIDVTGEGLGIDIIHEMNEEQLAELAEAERQHALGRIGGGGGDHKGTGRAIQRRGQAGLDEQDDGDDDEGDDDNDNDEDEDEDTSDDSEDSEDDDQQVLFEVKVTREGKPNPVGFWCLAGLDGRLYVEQVFTENKVPLNFSSLSENVQDRLYDFLDSIKLDDEFALVMRRRFYQTKRTGARETLEALVDLVAMDEPEHKPEPKKIDGKKKKNKSH